jgi:spermidine synthase
VAKDDTEKLSLREHFRDSALGISVPLLALDHHKCVLSLVGGGLAIDIDHFGRSSEPSRDVLQEVKKKFGDVRTIELFEGCGRFGIEMSGIRR